MLKKAGVVDAGGQGFLYILEGMQSVLKNGVMIESQDMDAPQVSRSAAAESEAEITFTYCTEFIVKRNPEAKKSRSCSGLILRLLEIRRCSLRMST